MPACRTGRGGRRSASRGQPTGRRDEWGYALDRRTRNPTGGLAIDAQIHGTVLPVLEVTLNPGDTIVSEAGEMSWMSQSIQMTTTTQTAGAKGVMGVLNRAVAGGGI